MICVIWWRYYDGSGCGIIDAYEDEAQAEREYKLLIAHGDSKEFTLWKQDRKDNVC